MLYNTILCATDGLEHSDRALAYATAIASRTGAELHVVQVTESSVGAGLLGDGDIATTPAERRARVGRQVAEMTRDGQVRVTPHFVTAGRGAAADRIACLAEKLEADVIVVGSRGQSPLGGALAGSVSMRLPRLTSRPVTVIATQHSHPALRTRWRRSKIMSANGREQG